MKTAFLYLYILELFILNIAAGWGYISRKGRGRGREWGTDKQLLPDKPPLKRCGETYRTGSSNVNLSFSEAQQKILC